MATYSEIGWTDHTFNPWWGCTKVHQGCKNCYAETLDARYSLAGKAHWGPRNPRRMIVGEWARPMEWNREAERSGVPGRVFCASMCDLFEDFDGPVVDQRGHPVAMRDQVGNWDVPRLRARVFRIIEDTPHLLWQLLTKRPENVTRMVPTAWLERWPENVMTGTSPCDQATADEAIPHLLKVPGRLFLSCEPLLGPLSLSDRGWLYDSIGGSGGERQIHWVITGGESGSGHRDCDPAWQESIVNQCEAAGVPVFVKQDSGPKPGKQGRLSDRVWAFKQFP